jgi:mersacidin/lichenicidin family type 2 lantibiotic
MKFDIARAWKDESYRNSLSSEEQALLPANPAGELELSESELEAVTGAGDKGGQTLVSFSVLLCAQSVLGICVTFGSDCS